MHLLPCKPSQEAESDHHDIVPCKHIKNWCVCPIHQTQNVILNRTRKEDRDPSSGWRQLANPNAKGNQARSDRPWIRARPRANSHPKNTPAPVPGRIPGIHRYGPSTPKISHKNSRDLAGGRRRRGDERADVPSPRCANRRRSPWLLAGWRWSGERRGGGEVGSGRAARRVWNWGISGSQFWGFKGSLRRPQRSDCSSLLAICVRATHVRTGQPLKTRNGL
jgi:hypothetical protein